MGMTHCSLIFFFKLKQPTAPRFLQTFGGHKATDTEHMVIATNLSSLFDLLHCSTPQTRAECCLELTAVSGYRMFLGPFR